MNAAIFIETRFFDPQIIRDHLKMLPDDFELIVYCSQNNIRLLNDFDNCNKYKVKIESLRDYNSFMTQPSLWDMLSEYKRVLIFQTDSKILRTGIEDFYKWNYIGAPWKFQETGGNGGLSLRNPKACLELVNRLPYTPSHGYEDVYFSNHLDNIAPRSECEKFSCETIYKLGTWGYHAIHNYLTKEQISTIENQYEQIEENQHQ